MQNTFNAIHTNINCDSVEPWLNDKSLGSGKTANYTNNTIIWYAPYGRGEIEAKAFINGKETAQYRLKTTGKPAQIALSADRNHIAADGQDLSHINIELVDEEGRVVLDADQTITVKVEGEGSLIGLDNDDPRVDGLRNGNTIKTYFGKALATVQSNWTSGKITIKVTSDDLPHSSLLLKSV